MKPLRREFEVLKEEIGRLTFGQPLNRLSPQRRKAAERLLDSFLERVRTITVLDPACGSGNFLYMALQSLKDLEREVLIWASTELRLPMQFPRVGPHQLRGIEINPYAAELTRVTIWIGQIQWMIRHGFSYPRDPVLQPLDYIETRDALIDWSDHGNPRESDWPDADVIIGNPPFLGGTLMRAGLGDTYVDTLFRVFDGRVPREADFVAYWHEKARAMVAARRAARVGLLATQGIRGGANRRVIERIQDSGDLFLAWSDEPWVLNGAAVHVSFLGYDDGSEREKSLDGRPVVSINPNLTAGIDLTKAKRLQENAGIAFIGDSKGGRFEIPAEMAHAMLQSPNPDGRSNRDVVRPWANGLDIAGRPRGMWIVDFGPARTEREGALYEAPFRHIEAHVHGAAISHLSAARQARYRAILRQVPAPSLVPLRLPEVAVFRKGDAALANHVYADDGDAFIYLNGWETDSAVPETTKPATVGWLRNGEREGWFCMPWRDGNIWRGFFPDFLIVREAGERLVLDIIDPHDHTKPDAVGKAKGLSDYAGKHADLLGHVDLVAKIGTRYRRLHLEQLAIRDKVDELQALSELRGLYVREG